MSPVGPSIASKPFHPEIAYGACIRIRFQVLAAPCRQVVGALPLSFDPNANSEARLMTVAWSSLMMPKQGALLDHCWSSRYIFAVNVDHH